MQEQIPDPLIGTLVDNRYRILERIADGGMSTVYLARHESLDRDVALKVLHRNLAADAAFVARFAQEARAAARLSHPNVVQVLDHGKDHAVTYLAMEFVQGHTLRQHMRQRGPVTPRAALELMTPILQGLAAAHASSLVHRDVKPENVLMADSGAVKIGDFGLARPATAQTSTGDLIGTAAYLAPELFLRQDADARSDVYSAGIVLHELLTGRVPFTGEMSIQVAYQHINDEVPPPSSIVPGLAADLDELVLWATAKDPEDRPVDAAALLGEVLHIMRILPDAELDLLPPGHRPAPPSTPPASASAPALASASAPTPGAAEDPERTEALGRLDEARTQALNALYQGDQQHTTVLGGAEDATSVLDRAEQHTTVLSSPAGATQVLAGASPATGGEDVPAPASKRQARRQQKEEAKARAKALATPQAQVRRGNPRRRGAIWLIIVLVLAVAAATAGWFFGIGPGAQVAVPDVKAKPADQAVAILHSAGLDSSQQEVYDDVVGQGLVVGTEPGPEATVPKWKGVLILVSRGPQLYAVPKVEGLDATAARNALNQAGMAVGKTSEDFSESVAKGRIISQDPAQGTQVRRSTPVSYVMSKGSKPVPVPNVVGKTVDESTNALKEAGFVAAAQQERVFSTEVPAGRVLSQTPASGDALKGSTVTLVISKGPRMIEVPNFVGKQASTAKEELEALGFKVQINNILDGFFGTVRIQSPGKGQAPEGSTIVLTVI